MSIAQIIKDLAQSITDSAFQRDIINVQLELRQTLEHSGYSRLKSAELAEEWWKKLRTELETTLSEWDVLGIPRPLFQTSVPTTYLTFKHHQYANSQSRTALPDRYLEIVEFIESLSTREFLLIPACLLQIAECDPIFITDGPNDGGIDCIGRVEAGTTRSLCLFAQSRTSSSQIQKDALQLECRKFEELQGTSTYAEYLAVLGAARSMDGRAICHLMVTNSDFTASSQRYAAEYGILLRSLRQTAFLISTFFDVAGLADLRANLSFKKSLKDNISPQIKNVRLFADVQRGT